MSPSTTAQRVAQAERHFRSGQTGAAEALLRQVIAQDAGIAKAYELLAYICGNRQDLAACEDFLRKAAALPDCAPEALFYLGRAQLQRGLAREAAAAFGRSMKMAGEYFEGLHELGVAHSALGEHEQALQAFRRAERLQPRSRELQSNLADTLAALRQSGPALQHYERALTLDPRYVQAWANRGTVLTDLGRGEEALQSYQRALALAPDDVPTWMNRAATLSVLKRHGEALACYDEVARRAPHTDYLAGQRLHAAMFAGRWAGWAAQVAEIVARIDAGEKAAVPFALMAWPVPSATLLQSARAFVGEKHPARASQAGPMPAQPRAGRRLRIGYFSTDFRDHPVSQLLVRVLECHDRDRFELHGFALGAPASDDMGRRVAAAFDRFTQVGGKSDTAIAAMAREAGIDIAVDLNGLTEGARPDIFAHRAAPVQVNYLGYPGSMGCDYIDYIVADDTLIAPDEFVHYAEKVVLLPGSYQANDDTKRIADAAGTRESAGLPPAGFVFACFNSNHKITPDVFDVWMRVLHAVPGSVLWLLEGSAQAREALSGEARARGVDPGRLVWAPRMPLAEHLARQAHADLFLDTFHYNAHTTAADALWSGLPVLTLAGATFPSRVGASLLRAIGLQELVTQEVADYEALAISLARSPERLAQLRRRLADHRTAMPLFDSALFARRLEAAFEAMWERRAEGLPPDHLRIGDEVR
ncbi:MAG: tetratricopeptide repeat protein [Variovorax sp.]|nr:tetratricopeptide repeat protein [Variovorax sp.]